MNNPYKNAWDKAGSNLAFTYSKHSPTIKGASFAFGGHISKGFLNRAKSAQNKCDELRTKMFQKEVFYLISELPNLWSYRLQFDTWDKVNEILSKCRLAKWFSDDYDYHNAERDIGCYPKILALTHFINKYGNSREKKLILTRLTKSS